MYRARIDAVSGTKVYADGKWLTAIGNKNFKTGSFIWTDGRCAYGNYQEAQQPSVIIAQNDDEGIPIFDAYKYRKTDFAFFYSFLKNKLKPVNKEENESGQDFLYSSMHFINGKRNSYLYQTSYYDAEAYTSYKVIASNVDNAGNIFFLLETIKYTDERRFDEQAHTIATFKSDKSSKELKFVKGKEFDVLNFFETTTAEKYTMPTVPYGDLIYGDGDGHTLLERGFFAGGAGVSVLNAFIDDENNFEFIVDVAIGYTFFEPGDWPVVGSAYEGEFQIKNASEINLLRETCENGKCTTEAINDKVYVYNDYETTHTEDNNHIITCSAGDGFYYSMTWQRIPKHVQNNTITAGGEYLKQFFSPNGTKIAQLNATVRSNSLFCKIKGGFLASITANELYTLFDQDVSTLLEDQYDEGVGIYRFSYSSRKLERLLTTACSNDRLRPIKKIKGWHKRVKKIFIADIIPELKNQDDKSAT